MELKNSGKGMGKESVVPKGNSTGGKFPKSLPTLLLRKFQPS
jgi:hypothetical protein